MTLELVDGAPHGLAAWSDSRDGEPQTAELICIHSRPSNWGKGYGAALMRHALLEMENAGFPTRRSGSLRKITGHGDFMKPWALRHRHSQISFGCEECNTESP